MNLYDLLFESAENDLISIITSVDKIEDSKNEHTKTIETNY